MCISNILLYVPFLASGESFIFVKTQKLFPPNWNYAF